MMVMPGIRLRTRRAFTIGCRRRAEIITMIGRIENDETERQVFVLGDRAARVLETINRAGQIHSRKNERQRDAKHRAEPKWRKLRQSDHICPLQSNLTAGKLRAHKHDRILTKTKDHGMIVVWGTRSPHEATG